MTQIIEYRTCNKGRASPGAECASASGNLGTIALVNSQFLFWLVSKGGDGGEAQANRFAPFSRKVTRGSPRFAIPLPISPLFFSMSAVKNALRIFRVTLPSLLICRRFFRDLSGSSIHLGIFALFAPVMRSIRFARPFTALLRSGFWNVPGKSRPPPFESCLWSDRGAHRKICNRCKHCRLKYRS